MVCFADTRKALRQRHSSTEQRRRRRENQSRENGEERRLLRLYSAAKNQVEATQEPSRASMESEMATDATGTPKKITDGEVSPAGTVHRNYRIATHFESQITPKFVW